MDMVIRNLRTDPYPTDRLIVRVLGPLLPSWVSPNQITWIRFLFTPGVFYLLWARHYAAGLVVFLFLALTDAVDGALARTRQKITPWGIMYDPIADKLLIGGTVLILVVHRLGWELAVIILGLEAMMLGGGIYFRFVRKTLLPANVWGKAKMVLQVVATAVLLIDALVATSWAAPAAFALYIIASTFAFFSLLSHGT